MTEPKVLDVNEVQKVQYCIPLWLRDAQIKQSIARVKARLFPPEGGSGYRRGEPIAIVCFGPSLNQTWEKIRDFKFVMSCSGAHKFLVERGIIPTWQVEVDPRAHKVALMGPPQDGVEYLISSTCHAKLFDHLEGKDVKLWHVFATDEEAQRVLPRGEWALTGGSNVGLRAMAIARFIGFTEQDVFGMDGSFEESTHAAEHPNAPKSHAITEYGGKTYRTTPGMLESARQTWHELNQMPDVVARFHGEGLVQAMAKDYQRKPGKDSILGVVRPELISPEYRELNRQLHESNLFYGVGGGKHAKTVIRLAATIEGRPPSVLDYGCGRGELAKALPFPIWEYDPAVPDKATPPRAADVVVATDVLEHVEPDKILFVLDDIRRATKAVGYFVIHTGPSSKLLADGRNAHVLQRDRAWWEKMLKTFFVVGKVIESGPLLHVVVGPKAVVKKKEKAV